MSDTSEKAGRHSSCAHSCAVCGEAETLFLSDSERENLHLQAEIRKLKATPAPITFVVPLKAQSVSNLREHWAVRKKRVESERAMTAYRTPPAAKKLGPFVVVTLTRSSARRLDDDNLRGALKSFRDQVASALGVDDRTSLVRWDYAQETGPDEVRISIAVAVRP